MSLYSTLGVDRDATPEQIKRAYRRRAAKSHPDVAPDKEAEFLALVLARDVLLNPESRAQYDQNGEIPKRSNPTAAVMMIRNLAVSCVADNPTQNLLGAIREKLSVQAKSLEADIRKCDKAISEVRLRWHEDEMKEQIMSEFEQCKASSEAMLKTAVQALELLKPCCYDGVDTAYDLFRGGRLRTW